jgi:IS30 family transposase
MGAVALGASELYFYPQSPRQRKSDENANGLLRSISQIKRNYPSAPSATWIRQRWV